MLEILMVKRKMREFGQVRTAMSRILFRRRSGQRYFFKLKQVLAKIPACLNNPYRYT